MKKSMYLCSGFNKQDCFTNLKKLRKMKKLVFMFVAIAAISFASCGQKTEQAAPAEDTVDTTAVDTTAADSVATDSVAE